MLGYRPAARPRKSHFFLDHNKPCPLRDGTHVDPSQLTVGQFLRTWLDEKQANVAGTTFDGYKIIVEKHLVRGLGKLKLAKLSPVQIQAYYSEALKCGHGGRDKNGRRGGPLSAQTVKHHHRVLSQALRKAVQLQLLTRNPCDAVDPPRPVHKEMPTLDNDQIKVLADAAEGSQIYLPIVLAVLTGLRRGEVLGLRWKDVDLAAGMLSVSQTIEETSKGLGFKEPKSARGRRRIPLPLVAVRKLQSHKAEQAAARLRVGAAYEDHDLVIAEVDGKPFRPSELTYQFTSLAKKLNLKARFHDLRHTHITQMLEEGVHPKVASERAGHASVAITLDRYSHVVPTLQEDAAAKIDKRLSGYLE